MDERLRYINSALKRAKRFGMKSDGPFTPIRCKGMGIPASNACLLLDAKEGVDFLGDLVILDYWAKSIDRMAEKTIFEGNQEAAIALGSFASRCPLEVM